MTLVYIESELVMWVKSSHQFKIKTKLSNVVFFFFSPLTDLLLGVSFPRPSVFGRQLCSTGALLSLFAPQSVLLDAHTGKRCLSNTSRPQKQKKNNYPLFSISISSCEDFFLLPHFIKNFQEINGNILDKKCVLMRPMFVWTHLIRVCLIVTSRLSSSCSLVTKSLCERSSF